MPDQLVCRDLDWQLSPASVLRLVRDDPHPVALFGAWAGGSDIVAAAPVRVCGAPGPIAEVLDAPLPGAWPSGAAFGGGWIGYLGFGLAGQFLPVPPAPGPPRQLPAWWFGYYDHVLRRDRATGRWTFEALCAPDRAAALEQRFAELSRRPRPPGAYSCGTFRLTPPAGEHRAAVRQTVSYIRRGDIFQANICLRLDAEFRGDPLDAFCHAVTQLDPPYAAFLRTTGGAVASLSPELFLRRRGPEVYTRPIKGTRARPAGDQAARRERAALRRSAKDRAENVMIVDLMRNDLSRVCLPGTVRVPALLRAEAHPGVWHLVSEVRGTLPAGAGDGPLVAAAFPPGSVTGAPKVRALEIIHELEATPREVYTGAIGYRSPVAGLELNVAIRTFEFAAGRVWLGSGGGITARSVDAAEYRECLVKANPLIHALNASASEAPDSPARPAGVAGQAATPPALRPRAAVGVFTSLRVTDGTAQDLDRHLARLDESSRELFGKPLPPELRTELAARLATRPSGRLRITARPVGGPLQAGIEVVPAGPVLDTVALHPVTVPGGVGGHKWADRRLLAGLAGAAGLGPDGQLLIEDSSGEVLETDRGNVFAVLDGVLVTPPADGRLLPGITRAAVLRLAGRHGLTATETPIIREQLRQASEVFVTNSVHGVVPVQSLGGTSWAAGPVTSQLRHALAHRPASPPPPPSAARPAARPGRILAAGQASRTGPVIVLVDNYDSFSYNLAHLLLGHGARVEVVRNDEVTPAGIAGFAPGGIVISPGPGTPADAGISVGTVQACAARTPVLGICLGHQAIAAAYGARIVTAEPVHGVAAPVHHDGQGVLAGLPPRFAAARYHSLIADETTLPPSLLITARGPGGIPMGLRHRTHLAEGLQFHPESILTPHGAAIMANFIRQAERSRRSAGPGRASATHR
jgi:para-aminobenzoate synthetase/4-amino-4-deoxychorismate lyase